VVVFRSCVCVCVPFVYVHAVGGNCDDGDDVGQGEGERVLVVERSRGEPRCKARHLDQRRSVGGRGLCFVLGASHRCEVPSSARARNAKKR